MQIDNIGHLSAPAERPFSDGHRRQGKIDFVVKALREICDDFGLSNQEFLKSRRQDAMTARHRVCVIAIELLRPELGYMEIAELLGMRHTTLITCGSLWRKHEGAE